MQCLNVAKGLPSQLRSARASLQSVTRHHLLLMIELQGIAMIGVGIQIENGFCQTELDLPKSLQERCPIMLFLHGSTSFSSGLSRP